MRRVGRRVSLVIVFAECYYKGSQHMPAAARQAGASLNVKYEKNFEMTLLNLSHLATFRLVVSCGSFSAAADALGLSQPAVSLQIRHLEQFLRTRLVERTGRGISPTAAGVALLEHSEQIGIAVDNAVRAVSEASQEVSGVVRIGTGATACIHLLPPLLQTLRTQWPALQVSVTTGNTVDITRAVEANLLDVGLVTLPVHRSLLSVSHCRDEEFVFIGQTLLNLTTAESLQQHPFIAFETGSGTRTLIDSWFAERGITLVPVMESGSVEAIKRMVRAGLGISIVPRMAVEQEEDREGLSFSSLTPVLHRQLALVMRPDKVLNRGLTEVVRLLS